jgi:pimeloyl-[acyl-carrier protein] methyl ester esterase
MTLHAETTGVGPDVVLLHGWGLHGGLFESLAAGLSSRHRVTCLDLPGHGRSAFVPPFGNLDELAQAVVPALPEACTLVGWSLGGMVAARLAADGCPAVERLVLVATTPRFVNGAGWTQGLERALVREFAAELGRDYRGVIRRFLSLQARGDERQAALLRQLRAEVFARGEPDPAALAAGLLVLTRSDLRALACRIRVPTLVMTGEYDRLTPPRASAWLASKIPGARHCSLPGAGHAPFLSHPQEFLAALRDFLPAVARRPAHA